MYGTFYCGSENKLVTHVGKQNKIGTANTVNHHRVRYDLYQIKYCQYTFPKEKKHCE